MIDLSKYSIFTTPNNQAKIVHNQKDDYEAVNEFNKSMIKIRCEYSTKEKLSHTSARKTVLTD